MFKKIDIRATLAAGALGAFLFCIPAFIYIYRADYTQSWLLYIGSFLFFIVMWIHTLRDSKKRGQNESTVALVFASHMATIAGIILSCLLCFVLLSVFIPGYLGGGTVEKTLDEAPVNIVKDKTNGLSFEVFIAATIINFSVGSFTAIILPFYSKRNQSRDSREPTPLHQHGTK